MLVTALHFCLTVPWKLLANSSKWCCLFGVNNVKRKWYSICCEDNTGHQFNKKMECKSIHSLTCINVLDPPTCYTMAPTLCSSNDHTRLHTPKVSAETVQWMCCFFSSRFTTSLWNTFPRPLRALRTKNSFKSSLKTHCCMIWTEDTYLHSQFACSLSWI